MFKQLAFAAAAAAWLLFTFGCEKKAADPIAAELKKIPVSAPAAAADPGAVIDHLRYVMVRKDPKHLEAFLPDNKERAFGAINEFHFRAGWYGFGLSAGEIDTIGAQDLLKDGFISDKWTAKDIREAMEGKRGVEQGMERFANNLQLDMQQLHRTPPLDKKLHDQLVAERKKAMEKNLKAAFASGLYRWLKVIPEDGWPMVKAEVKTNTKDKSLNDLVLSVGDVRLGAAVIGKNEDGRPYIWNLEYEQTPAAIGRLFQSLKETGD